MAAYRPISGRAARISKFLGLQRSTLGVLAMVVLVGMGERMAERFLPIYILALGGGALAIGLLQAMDNLLSALYSFPGGYFSDRIGTKRSLFVFNLVAMAGFRRLCARVRPLEPRQCHSKWHPAIAALRRAGRAGAHVCLRANLRAGQGGIEPGGARRDGAGWVPGPERL